MKELINLLKRLPHSTASAYADGILGVLKIRPDLRRDYSPEDLAWLQSVGTRQHYAKACPKCDGSRVHFFQDGISVCECVPKFSEPI